MIRYAGIAGRVWVIEIYTPHTKRWRRLKNTEWYRPSMCPIDTKALDGRRDNRGHLPSSNLEDTIRVLKACKVSLAICETRGWLGWRLRIRNINTQDVVLAEIL